MPTANLVSGGNAIVSPLFANTATRSTGVGNAVNNFFTGVLDTASNTAGALLPAVASGFVFQQFPGIQSQNEVGAAGQQVMPDSMQNNSSNQDGNGLRLGPELLLLGGGAALLAVVALR